MSVAAGRDPAEPIALPTPGPRVLDVDGGPERRSAVGGTAGEHRRRTKEVVEPRDPRIDHGPVALDLRDLLGRVGADVLARPAHPIGEVVGADSAEALKLQLVLSELGSADDGTSRGHALSVPEARHASHRDGYPTRSARACRG